MCNKETLNINLVNIQTIIVGDKKHAVIDGLSYCKSYSFMELLYVMYITTCHFVNEVTVWQRDIQLEAEELISDEVRMGQKYI